MRGPADVIYSLCLKRQLPLSLFQGGRISMSKRRGFTLIELLVVIAIM